MDYDERTIQQVWERARAVPDQDPDEWRLDECGAWIRREQYGARLGEFGWRILNTEPGPNDNPARLRPFHYENDFDIANRRPRCRVTADHREEAPGTHVPMPVNRMLEQA